MESWLTGWATVDYYGKWTHIMHRNGMGYIILQQLINLEDYVYTGIRHKACHDLLKSTRPVPLMSGCWNSSQYLSQILNCSGLVGWITKEYS